MRRPFQREPDFDAASVNYTMKDLLASVNYTMKDLLARAEEPGQSVAP